jgi:hypothetical protein
VVEGTSGAADCVLFREGAQEAALQGRPSFGEVCWAIPFDRGRNRTVVELSWAFKLGPTRDCDRRCPSQSGWGKSTAASGRCGGGRESLAAKATPDLTQLGWECSFGDTTTRSGSICCQVWMGSSQFWVCSGDTPLQKSVGGMWPQACGE